jgi:hypothetical protein
MGERSPDERSEIRVFVPPERTFPGFAALYPGYAAKRR